jgi:hypothetical protein
MRKRFFFFFSCSLLFCPRAVDCFDGLSFARTPASYVGGQGQWVFHTKLGDTEGGFLSGIAVLSFLVFGI